jgi:NAD(P)-dependent dehydrogenase (short-subunit alcohol dehydrogenase family)
MGKLHGKTVFITGASSGIGAALALEADVTKDGDVDRAAATASAELGGIDVVIANAGFGVVGRLEKLELADFRRQFETNVFGVLRTVYATLPALRRSKGCLVLIGSVAGYLPSPGSSAYSMSKAAVTSLALSLRGELAADGVSVVLITPGFVESEIRGVDNKGRLREGAKEIRDAVVHRERERVLTRHGKAAVYVARHAPGLVSGALDVRAKLSRRPA